mmetsp:Transcript_1309/g.2184  ORF Transcript_1309/g.2184 Transcript_1309/m.2184 type:complete len:405 (-) Transcript_1309:229-1443(-)
MAAALAKELRAATSSEDFDLAGYGANGITDLMAAAFKDPIPSEKMLGFRFTVGGGKKVRQKYGDDMPKYCRDALRAIGYEEDRGASAVLACQGMFKYQHDTDKDLKFIHVFPKIDVEAAKAAKPAADDDDEEITVAGMKIEDLPPSHLCTIISRSTFQQLLNKQCPSFSQKKALLKAMKEMAHRIEHMEKKMAEMQQLSAEEEEIYSSQQELPEKLADLEKQLQDMMKNGNLTKAEIERMVKDFEEKKGQLEGMIQQSKDAGKKTQKLEENLQVLDTQIQSLKSATPVVHRRKEDREILTLRKQLRDLKTIEESKQLVSLEDMKKLNAKPQIMARLEELEAERKGWFDEAVPEEDQLKDPPPKKGGGSGGGDRGWETSSGKGAASNKGRGGGGVKSSNPWSALG